MKISLNGIWSARTDAQENGLAEHWAAAPIKKELEVSVPGCIQQIDCLAAEYPPHNDMRNGYENTYFLEKSVNLPELKKGERCRLTIGGVIPSCHIWINGTYVSKNILGLNRIHLDITDDIVCGENRITVAVTEQYASLITGMRFAGMNWSGIYSEAYIEIAGALQIQNPYLSLKDGKAVLCAVVDNDADEDCNGELTITLTGNQAEEQLANQGGKPLEKRVTVPISVPAHSSEPLAAAVEVTGLPRWSYREPNLITAALSCRDSYGNECGCEFRTGLRELTVEKDRILVDGTPTFFAGTGSEYYSPTIAPLTDRAIIESRYQALKAYGFNFYRCHTHVPTEEEMDIADEMGIMLDVEFGLVSNFNKTTPEDKGMEMQENFVRQTRRHPSVFVYCLGNEGSQLMVASYIERNKAKMGYRIIKENTDNQLAIIAFGMQGELPELENDFETPHLWSDNFLWSYDGLTDIPWKDLERATNGKPCVIHEYGKYGVWPSRQEEADCTIENGIKPSYGTQAYEWLKENDLEELEERLVCNSRRAANRFNQIILEDARRQTYCSGYALWTFFRRSGSNAGLSDDIGRNLNGDCERFRLGANADVAILMDRGFQNRAFPCDVEQTILISLSNFGPRAVRGLLTVAIGYEEDIIAENSVEVSSGLGETRRVLPFLFRIPADYSGKKLKLTAKLRGRQESGGRAENYAQKNAENRIEEEPIEELIAKNEWDLWAFDASANLDVDAYLHIEDLTMFRAVKKKFPNAQRLSSVDSIIIGCRSWTNPELAKTAGQQKDRLLIADEYDEVVKACIQNGCKVLLLDSGRLPKDWMLPPIKPELGERDTGRFFASFRAGWDKGNLVTVVNDDPLLGAFPQEGFLDLHFYDMVQSARIMKPEIIRQELGAQPKRIIVSLSKIPAEAGAESVVQDPNAIKEQKQAVKKSFNAREQGYFLKLHDRLAVCTLKLTDNLAGLALLKEIAEHF